MIKYKYVKRENLKINLLSLKMLTSICFIIERIENEFL